VFTEFGKSIKHGTIYRGLLLLSGTAVCLLLVWERAHTIGKELIITPDFINVNANWSTLIWARVRFVLGSKRQGCGVELRLGGDTCLCPALPRFDHRHGQQGVHTHSREIRSSVQDHYDECTFVYKCYARNGDTMHVSTKLFMNVNKVLQLGFYSRSYIASYGCCVSWCGSSNPRTINFIDVRYQFPAPIIPRPLLRIQL
jgi:hypothetical protein